LFASKTGQGRGIGHQALDLGRNRLLGVVERRQKNARLAVDGVGEQHLVLDFLGDGGLDDLFGDVEQLHRQRQQFDIGQAAVPLGRGFAQRIRNAGLGTQGRVLGDADLLGNGVGGEKADAANVLGEPVGVFPNHVDGPWP
jgi:hypothetical protein